MNALLKKKGTFCPCSGNKIMSEFEQMKRGQELLIEGRSDEDVETIAGISLLQIIELRGAAAAAPGDVAAFTPRQYMFINEIPTA